MRVGTKPRQTALTLTLNGARAIAADCVRLMTPIETVTPCSFRTGTRAAVDDRLTILPPRCFIITRAAAWIPEEHGLQVDREGAIVVRLGHLEAERCAGLRRCRRTRQS